MSQSSTYTDDAGQQRDELRRASQVARASRLQIAQAADEQDGLDGIVGDVQRFGGNSALNHLLQRQEAPGRKPKDADEKDPHHKRLAHPRVSNEAPGAHRPDRAPSGSQTGHPQGREAHGQPSSPLKAYGIHAPVKSLLNSSNTNTQNVADDAYYGFDNQLHYGSPSGPIQVPNEHNPPTTDSLSPDLLKLYQRASVSYRVPLALLLVQGANESDFYPHAESGDGGYGIAQFTDASAAHKYMHIPANQDWLAAAEDPTKAIPGQAYYMEDLYDHPLSSASADQHNWHTALAEYNGGGNPSGVAENYADRILHAAYHLDSQFSTLLTHHNPPTPPPGPHGSNDGITPGTEGHINAYDVPLEEAPGGSSHHKLSGGETITAVDSGSTHRPGWVYIQVTDGSLHGAKGWVAHRFFSPGKARNVSEDVADQPLNLRSSAEVEDHNLIGTLPPGTRLRMLEQEHKKIKKSEQNKLTHDVTIIWDQVVVLDGHYANKTGWVAHTYDGSSLVVDDPSKFGPPSNNLDPYPLSNLSGGYSNDYKHSQDCTWFAWYYWHERGVDLPPTPHHEFYLGNGGSWATSLGILQQLHGAVTQKSDGHSVVVRMSNTPEVLSIADIPAGRYTGTYNSQPLNYISYGHVAIVTEILSGCVRILQESYDGAPTGYPEYGAFPGILPLSPRIMFLHFPR